MMLIRDERQAALNDIIEHCRQAAELYREAAGLTRDGSLAALFASIGRLRGELAAGLAPHVRRLGDLPAAPDRDRETVAELTARIKSALAEDERLELLAERQRGEDELQRLVAAALRQELPGETDACLRDALKEIAATRERLAAARAAIASPD
jgi:uncharacterized protein (TIGR02284 family)